MQTNDSTTQANNSEKAVFRRGDVIDFCEDQYLVLANHGNSGRVQEYPAGNIIEPFYWNFDGAECKKIGSKIILD